MKTQKEPTTLTNQIDWEFIECLEGASILDGYVPVNKEGEVIGRSGVTIGSGIDLGQMSHPEMRKLFQGHPDLLEKLLPYAHLAGKAAVRFLAEHPLHLTESEVNKLDTIVRIDTMHELKLYWQYATNESFFSLPKEVQTVLVSLAWNFGSNLPDKLPNTFKLAVTCMQNNSWGTFREYLFNFPSKNKELQNRRRREASYLLPLG